MTALACDHHTHLPSRISSLLNPVSFRLYCHATASLPEPEHCPSKPTGLVLPRPHPRPLTGAPQPLTAGASPPAANRKPSKTPVAPSLLRLARRASRSSARGPRYSLNCPLPARPRPSPRLPCLAYTRAPLTNLVSHLLAPLFTPGESSPQAKTSPATKPMSRVPPSKEPRALSWARPRRARTRRRTNHSGPFLPRPLPPPPPPA